MRLHQPQHHRERGRRLAARVHLPLRLPRLRHPRPAAGDVLVGAVPGDGVALGRGVPHAPGLRARRGDDDAAVPLHPHLGAQARGPAGAVRGSAVGGRPRQPPLRRDGDGGRPPRHRRLPRLDDGGDGHRRHVGPRPGGGLRARRPGGDPPTSATATTSAPSCWRPTSQRWKRSAYSATGEGEGSSRRSSASATLQQASAHAAPTHQPATMSVG